MRRILFLLALFLAISSFAGIRIAVLGDVDKERLEADCLVQRLSSDNSIELVERSEIDRILKEHGISLNSTASDGDALKAGAILGAQGMIIVKSFEWEGKHVLSARLLATESGAILDAWMQDVPSKEAGRFADAVCYKFSPLFKKLSLDRKDFTALSLLNFRASVDKPELRELERTLTLLLSQRLMQERGFVVLERWRLGNVAWEKELNLDSNPLWTGSCLVDGSVELSQDSSNVKAAMRLRRPGGQAETIEASGPAKDLKAIVESLAFSLKTRLGKTGEKVESPAPAWDMAKEADFYFKEAEWLLRAGAYEEAREAADAASALGKRGPEMTFVHIKSLLGEINDAKQGKAESPLKVDNRHGRMAEPANCDRLLQALDIYVKFVEAGPRPLPGKFSEEKDWRMLGERLLAASSDILREIYAARLYASDRQWAERASLIRSMARRAVMLTMDKGDSASAMSLFYSTYLRFAVNIIFESREDYVAEFRRILAREFPLQPEMRYEIRHCLCAHSFAEPCDWSLRSGDVPALAQGPALAGLARELEASGTIQGRVDALVLSGIAAPPERIQALLWERREELLEGQGRHGSCVAAFLFSNYASTRVNCLDLLLYAFARDKAYDGETIYADCKIPAEAPWHG